MYKLQPLANAEIACKPSCMYAVKSYFEDIPLASGSKANQQGEDAISKLNQFLQRQNKIVDTLNKLEAHVNSLLAKAPATAQQQPTNKNPSPNFTLNNIEALFKNELEVQKRAKKNSRNDIVQDIVIQIDAHSQLATSIFIQIKRLFGKYKCFMQFYASSTVLNEINHQNPSIAQLNKVFTPLESRLKYDFGFSIILTKFSAHHHSEPVMHIAKANESNVIGEASILRYLDDLLGNQSVKAQADDWIDRLTNTELHIEKNAQRLLSDFNKTLQGDKKAAVKSQSGLSICHLYYFSRLSQQKRTGGLEALNNWLKNIESILF